MVAFTIAPEVQSAHNDAIAYFAITVACIFVGLWIIFYLSWKFCASDYAPDLLRDTFVGFKDDAVRAEFCSRINSTVVCVTMVIAGLITVGMNTWLIVGDSSIDLAVSLNAYAAQMTKYSVICVAAGYFAQDSVVAVVWRYDGWVVFLIHHIVAGSTFYLYLFAGESCRHVLLFFALMLQVEWGAICVSIQAFMRDLGYTPKNSDASAFVLHLTTVVVWPTARMGLPLWILVQLTRYKLYTIPCMAICFACCIAIVVFSWAVFFFVLLPPWLIHVGWMEEPPQEEEDEEAAAKRAPDEIVDKDKSAHDGDDSHEPAAVTTETSTDGDVVAATVSSNRAASGRHRDDNNDDDWLNRSSSLRLGASGLAHV